MKEGYENATVKHLDKLSVERFSQHCLEREVLVKHFFLVLDDQIGHTDLLTQRHDPLLYGRKRLRSAVRDASYSALPVWSHCLLFFENHYSFNLGELFNLLFDSDLKGSFIINCRILGSNKLQCDVFHQTNGQYVVLN